jgi:DNA-binding response OmpR family regulator
VTATDNEPNRAPATVVILADDLIWSSRLVAAVRGAGGRPAAVTSAGAFTRAVETAQAPVVVDLGGRGYDGIAQVRRAARAGLPVLAVAQHDDVELRRRALAAGARRVFSYNKLYRDGPRVVAALLAGKL